MSIYVLPNNVIVYGKEFLTEEEKEIAREVESMPTPEDIPGKTPVLVVDYDNKVLKYDYVEEQKTDIQLLQEENQKLRESQAEQDSLIMQLMLGGM